MLYSLSLPNTFYPNTSKYINFRTIFFAVKTPRNVASLNDNLCGPIHAKIALKLRKPTHPQRGKLQRRTRCIAGMHEKVG